MSAALSPTPPLAGRRLVEEGDFIHTRLADFVGTAEWLDGPRRDELEQRVERIEAAARQCQQRQHEGADKDEDERDGSDEQDGNQNNERTSEVQDMTMTTPRAGRKICRGCDRDLPLSAYPVRGRSKRKRTSWGNYCHGCTTANQRELYVSGGRRG